MRISILDDYHDTLRTLPCFQKLASHDVTVWNDRARDVETLAERLRDTEISRPHPRTDEDWRPPCSNASTS